MILNVQAQIGDNVAPGASIILHGPQSQEAMDRAAFVLLDRALVALDKYDIVVDRIEVAEIRGEFDEDGRLKRTPILSFIVPEGPKITPAGSLRIVPPK